MRYRQTICEILHSIQDSAGISERISGVIAHETTRLFKGLLMCCKELSETERGPESTLKGVN